LVQVGKEIYALPLRSVVETVQMNPKHVHWVEGSEVLCLREETLALLRLDRMFPARPDFLAQPGDGSLSPTSGDEGRKVVILGVAEKRFALLVDQLLGQESTVIKPLGAFLHRCSSVAGATISGDGQVRLVLDPAGLLANLQPVPTMIQKASA